MLSPNAVTRAAPNALNAVQAHKPAMQNLPMRRYGTKYIGAAGLNTDSRIGTTPKFSVSRLFTQPTATMTALATSIGNPSHGIGTLSTEILEQVSRSVKTQRSPLGFQRSFNAHSQSQITKRRIEIPTAAPSVPPVTHNALSNSKTDAGTDTGIVAEPQLVFPVDIVMRSEVDQVQHNTGAGSTGESAGTGKPIAQSKGKRPAAAIGRMPVVSHRTRGKAPTVAEITAAETHVDGKSVAHEAVIIPNYKSLHGKLTEMAPRKRWWQRLLRV